MGKIAQFAREYLEAQEKANAAYEASVAADNVRRGTKSLFADAIGLNVQPDDVLTRVAQRLVQDDQVTGDAPT